MASLFTKIILALVLFLPATSCGSAARNQRPADYRSYFQTVKHALEQTAAADFAGALDTYCQLFRRYRFVFARDALNALQLAIHTNNQSARDSLVKRGAESGVTRKAFLQNAAVSAAYFPTDSLLFEKLFLAGRAVWASRVDTALRREMIERYKLEQESKGGPEYKRVCTDNFQRIAALAKAGRFPGEQRIGVNDDLENGYVFATLNIIRTATACLNRSFALRCSKARHSHLHSLQCMASTKFIRNLLANMVRGRTL